MRRRPGLRSAPAVLALAAGLVALLGGSAPAGAAAACEFQVVYLGAPYLNAGGMSATVLAGPLGRASVPACVTPPPSTQVVEVERLRGVAPRLAVGIRVANAGAYVLTASGTPCRLGDMGRSLACLRRRTARLLVGPSLITAPSAHAGSVIRLAVHVRDPLRRGVYVDLAATLERREGPRWVAVARLRWPAGAGAPPPPVPVGAPYPLPALAVRGGVALPVRLPTAAPGQYRIVKDVTIGSRMRHLVAPLTILA